MKKYKMIGFIIIVILLISTTVLFLSKASKEGGEEYFEGKILETADNYIVVELDKQYEKLIKQVGEYIEIKKEEVVKKSDFSQFIQDEDVRVLYSGIDLSERKIEKIFAVYLLSELEKR